RIGGFDPASETVRVLPQSRWVGTYRSPGGHHYRVMIDRWRTPPEARRSYLGLDGDGHAAIVWGAYVVRVDAFDDDGGLLPGAMGNDDARMLVSAVAVPGENRSLGNQCAFTLMGNPPS
ncbi:MAG: hypothetical protein R3324_18755, partial [Halobacteriales archaeon]|nr:hypothetical protein [Halobacteriales archaeon]